jgi:hypothetical protein
MKRNVIEISRFYFCVILSKYSDNLNMSSFQFYHKSVLMSMINFCGELSNNFEYCDKFTTSVNTRTNDLSRHFVRQISRQDSTRGIEY